MIFVLFILAVALFSCSDISAYEPDIWYCALLALDAVTGAAHIVLLTISVYRDTGVKKLGARVIWSILTFIGGIPIAIIYALFTHNAGKYNDKPEKRKNIIRAVLSVILLVIFCFCANLISYNAQTYMQTHFTKYYVTYKNASGEEVIYDKMGNAYTFEEHTNLKYYDRKGNSYQAIIDYEYDDVFSSNEYDTEGYKCLETNREYYFDDYDFLIDDSGYLIIAPYGSYKSFGLVYYDDIGNIYYDINLCQWSPEGEIVFNGENAEYNGITYDDIIRKSKAAKEEEIGITIDKLFYDWENGLWESILYNSPESFTDNYLHENDLFGFKSAELVRIVDEGHIDGDENKYFATVEVKGEATENSAFYNPEKKKVTAEFTIILEYAKFNERTNEEWAVTDFTTDI